MPRYLRRSVRLLLPSWANLLVIDPRVDVITFTGSSAGGKRIMKKGASILKRVLLVLGGKSADWHRILS